MPKRMSITRLDCSFCCNGPPESRGARALNPIQKPGSLVVAAATAGRDNICGHVASKLGLDHFMDGVLEAYGDVRPRNGESGVSVLEEAFRRANSCVYEFGHKLAAGGRMAASLIGIVIADGTASCGRVGTNSAFLYRGFELFPFFENDSSDQFIGSQSLVSVQISSIAVEPSDTFILFSNPLDDERRNRLVDILEEDEWQTKPDAALSLSKQLYPGGDLSFLVVVRVGPDAIYLRKPLQTEVSP